VAYLVSVDRAVVVRVPLAKEVEDPSEVVGESLAQPLLNTQRLAVALLKNDTEKVAL